MPTFLPSGISESLVPSGNKLRISPDGSTSFTVPSGYLISLEESGKWRST